MSPSTLERRIPSSLTSQHLRNTCSHLTLWIHTTLRAPLFTLPLPHMYDRILYHMSPWARLQVWELFVWILVMWMLNEYGNDSLVDGVRHQLGIPKLIFSYESGSFRNTKIYLVWPNTSWLKCCQNKILTDTMCLCMPSEYVLNRINPSSQNAGWTEAPWRQ